MRILAIETSCDDTGVTIFKGKGSARSAFFEILLNLVSSQTIHAKYGGVFPAMAKQEHIKNLPLLTEFALKKIKGKIDAIAVTSGPGLEPCLWSGIVFAKELAEKWKVPLIPVNHMEGHIFSVFAKAKGKFKINLPKSKFPMLALLVSGGHTELVLVKDLGKYEIIGKTLDDAAGEAYDKVARMLGLDYPGGVKISKLAEEARKEKLISNFSFPRPMLKSPNLNFSFAGLKTSVLYALRAVEKLDEETKKKVALEFENAVVETLVYKTAKAVETHKVKQIILAGGVAANKHLKREMQKIFGKERVLFPEKILTGDNALMIGVIGYLRFLQNKKKVLKKDKIKAEGNLEL